jgi:acyl-CoA thioesterase-1
MRTAAGYRGSPLYSKERQKMKFTDKLISRAKDNWNQPTASVAFLGDSVTQGCFEIYTDANNEIVPVFDQSAAYETDFAKIMSILFPNAPITILNAGVSGSNAVHGLERLKRDILPMRPDLTVVCFALNDSANGTEGIPAYISALREIFQSLRQNQMDALFLTPNMMATEVDCSIGPGVIRDAAAACVNVQNTGVLDAYISAAKLLCKEMSVPVCDCYGIWKDLNKMGVNTNALLSNHINHPTREMNWLFAYELSRAILSL